MLFWPVQGGKFENIGLFVFLKMWNGAEQINYFKKMKRCYFFMDYFRKFSHISYAKKSDILKIMFKKIYHYSKSRGSNDHDPYFI